VTIPLTDIGNAQTITVTLNNVNARQTSASAGVLIGDSNGDRTVNSGDALQTRNRSGQTTNGTNFRSDVNADGVVNGGDVIVVRNRSGNSLP
jgi:hypothetical protein